MAWNINIFKTVNIGKRWKAISFSGSMYFGRKTFHRQIVCPTAILAYRHLANRHLAEWMTDRQSYDHVIWSTDH